MSTSRREFFTYTGATAIGAAMAAGLGAGVLPLAAGAAPAAGKVKFRVSGRTGTIGKRGPEALAFAKELGLEGVEIEAHDGREIGESLDCMNADAQKRYLDEAQKTGVAVSSVCMGHMNSYPVWDDPRAKAWIEGTIDATAALGAKHILVPFFGKADLRAQGSDRPDAAKREKSIAVLKACAPRAEAKGVALCIESYLEASDAMAMAKAVGSPAVRVYYDFGNSSVRGYDVPKEIRTLGKDYLAIVHFKNHDDLLGRGDKIDMAAVKQAMTDIGYEGWIVLETSGKPLGPERSAVYNTAFIRGLFC
jgi:sugar phosphate isomerase/epimerase